MMLELTRRQTLEIQAGADALLTPGGGGIAVWVRRDELQPRVAVRFSTAKQEGEEIDAAMLATYIATLRAGVLRLEQSLADSMNMERETFAEMTGIAFSAIEPRVEAATNIIRKPKP